MAKKKTNNENKEIVVSNDNEYTIAVNDSLTVNTPIITTEGVVSVGKIVNEKEMLDNCSKISNVSLIDLMFLEKACALLCKRYETSARIDDCNNRKFKEYKEYYEKIFSELEIRVLNACK